MNVKLFLQDRTHQATDYKTLNWLRNQQKRYEICKRTNFCFGWLNSWLHFHLMHNIIKTSKFCSWPWFVGQWLLDYPQGPRPLARDLLEPRDAMAGDHCWQLSQLWRHASAAGQPSPYGPPGMPDALVCNHSNEMQKSNNKLSYWYSWKLQFLNIISFIF